jgi:hypothetical protein
LGVRFGVFDYSLAQVEPFSILNRRFIYDGCVKREISLSINQSNKVCIELTATANALYLRSLEDWLSASIKCEAKGLTEKERLKNIKESYERAIKSNIEYHELMAKTESELGENGSSGLHSAMAKAYSSFILS